MLAVQGLEKSFDGKPAVRGVSFTLEKGEVLGFLGPNGAGKSTTMRMIAGFLEADAGTALIEGHDIASDRRAAQASLGYLPEGAPSYGAMTPWHYLMFLARLRGMADTRKAVEQIVEDVRLTRVLRQPIDTLSKGYRRRVGLASALLHRPPVLLLDEPTDGLDPNQKDVVRDLIRHRAADTAILISTHILDEVPAVCTRVMLVADGRIIADDTPAGLAAMSPSGLLEDSFRMLTRGAEVAA